jgi:hypothetical protein
MQFKKDEMNFPISSHKQVHKRYSLGVLGLLSWAKDKGHLDPRLAGASASVFFRVIYAEMDNCLTALFTKDDSDILLATSRLTERLVDKSSVKNSGQADFSQPVFIGDEYRLPVALGRSEEAAPKDITTDAWNEAIALLRESGHPGLGIVEGCAISVLGLNNRFGEVMAFSDKKLPGFLAFGVNNPPGVLAEELLHESVHTLIWSYLQLNPSVADSLHSLYGVYSTFVKRGRTAVRVLHGALSYGAVCSLWITICKSGLAGKAFATTDTEGRRLAEYRISTLQNRVATSLDALENVCRNGEIADLASATQLSWALEAVSAEGCGKGSIEEQIQEIRAVATLNDVTKAEILLALIKEKQSRTVLPIDQLEFLDAFGRAGGKYVIGHTLVKSDLDQKCAGFSNVVASTFELDSDDGGLDAFVYFGSDLSQIAETARLDNLNLAGTLLGIPECCQLFFSLNWDRVRNHGGDLFGHLLSKQPKVSSGHIECDVSALYRGKGLCWHFPCELHCENTRRVVQNRTELLTQIDPVLSERLITKAKRLLLWSSTRGYCFVEGEEVEHLLTQKLKWINGEDFLQPEDLELSVEEWVSNPLSAELRRVVRFS